MWSADVNLITVLVSGVALMILGFIWYSPLMFGKTYMKLITCGETPSPEKMKEMQSAMMPAYLLTFVGSLITSYVLAIFISALQATTLQASTTVAFWLWLGFMLPVSLGNVLFGNKTDNTRWTLLGITAGNYLVGLLIVAAIFTYWS